VTVFFSGVDLEAPSQGVRLAGFRRWAVLGSCCLVVSGASLGAALIYAGFIAPASIPVGVAGIVVIAGVFITTPRVWRGGWLDLTADALEVHSPWSTRVIPYDDIEDVTVFSGRFTSRSGARVQYMPAIARHSGRRVLLNDFHAWGSPADPTIVPPQVTVVVDQIRDAQARHRESSADPA
jgi:hypothetical protein